MHQCFSLPVLLTTLAAIVAAYVPESTEATDLEAAKSLSNLLLAVETGELGEHLATRNVGPPCSQQEVSVRRE
jgi:hypothetical protein